MVAGVDAASTGVAGAGSELLSAAPLKPSSSPTKAADSQISPCESIEDYASELMSDVSALAPPSKEVRDEPSVEKVERAAEDERAQPEEEVSEPEPQPAAVEAESEEPATPEPAPQSEPEPEPAVVEAKSEEPATPEPVLQEPIEPAVTAAEAKDTPPAEQPAVADSPPAEQPPTAEGSPAAEQPSDIVAEPEESTEEPAQEPVVEAEDKVDTANVESTKSKKKRNNKSSNSSKSKPSKSMSSHLSSMIPSLSTKKLSTKKVTNVFARVPLSPASAAKLKAAADDSSVVSGASTASRASRASRTKASSKKSARRSLLKKLTPRSSRHEKGAAAKESQKNDSTPPEAEAESNPTEAEAKSTPLEAEAKSTPLEAEAKSTEVKENPPIVEVEQVKLETKEVEVDQKRPADLPTNVVATTNEAAPSPMAGDEPPSFFEMISKTAVKYCDGITTNLCGFGLENVDSAEGKTKEAKELNISTQMCCDADMAARGDDGDMSPLSIATERIRSMNKSALESLENAQAAVSRQASKVFPAVPEEEDLQMAASKGSNGGDMKPTSETQPAPAESSNDSVQPTDTGLVPIVVVPIVDTVIVGRETDDVAEQPIEKPTESSEEEKETTEVLEKPAEPVEAAEAERSTGKLTVNTNYATPSPRTH